MQEYRAAAACDARRAVVIDLDDKIIEVVVTPQPVAADGLVQPDRLMRVFSKDKKPEGGFRSFSYPNYADLRDSNTGSDNERGRERYLPMLKEHLEREAGRLLAPGKADSAEELVDELAARRTGKPVRVRHWSATVGRASTGSRWSGARYREPRPLWRPTWMKSR